MIDSNSSVIRQKGESQNGCFKKTKHAKFSEKRTFLTSSHAHVRERIRVLDSPFCLITDELAQYQDSDNLYKSNDLNF